MALMISISPAGERKSIMSLIRLTHSSSLTTVVRNLFLRRTFIMGDGTLEIEGESGCVDAGLLLIGDGGCGGV